MTTIHFEELNLGLIQLNRWVIARDNNPLRGIEPWFNSIESWFHSADHGPLHMTTIHFEELNLGLIQLNRGFILVTMGHCT